MVDPVQIILGNSRRRRFAMKMQQKIDRALESYVRQTSTDWHPEMSDADRARIKKEVAARIKSARDDESDPNHRIVLLSVNSRAPWDELRKACEKEMAAASRLLPVWPWVESVRGAAENMLYSIIGEAGDLSKYATHDKLWKRLGYAPYDGHAGSTWKRESWRERALTKQEWEDNPFSGERYGIIYALADSMFKAQWVGKKHTEDGKGKPGGPYGERYAHRRAWTVERGWTDGHAHKDALRYMMKHFLRDLHREWHHAMADEQVTFAEAAE